MAILRIVDDGPHFTYIPPLGYSSTALRCASWTCRHASTLPYEEVVTRGRCSNGCMWATAASRTMAWPRGSPAAPGPACSICISKTTEGSPTQQVCCHIKAVGGVPACVCIPRRARATSIMILLPAACNPIGRTRVPSAQAPRPLALHQPDRRCCASNRERLPAAPGCIQVLRFAADARTSAAATELCDSRPHLTSGVSHFASVHFNAPINLKVVSQDGNEVFFKCRAATAPLGVLMRAFCMCQGVRMSSARFLFDGTLINEGVSPFELEIEDGDIGSHPQ